MRSHWRICAGGASSVNLLLIKIERRKILGGGGDKKRKVLRLTRLDYPEGAFEADVTEQG